MTQTREEYRRGRLAEALRDNLKALITMKSGPTCFDFEGRYELRFNFVENVYECECLGFRHRGFCRHLAALLLYIVDNQINPPDKRQIHFSLGGKRV